MAALITLLVTVALADSTTMLPMGLLSMATLLGSEHGRVKSAAFIFGIFACYFVGGVVIAFSLDAIAAYIDPVLERFWNHPTTFETVLQLIIAIAVVGFAFRLYRSHDHDQAAAKPATNVSIAAAFLLGVSLTVVGLPGALLYLGAIERILSSDLQAAGMWLMLVIYNVAFVALLLSVLAMSRLSPQATETVTAWTTRAASRWGHRVVAAILLICGVVYFADGIGWIVGAPLLPLYKTGGA